MPRFDTHAHRMAYRAAATAVIAGSLIALGFIARDRDLLHETLGSAGLSLVAFGKFVILRGLDEGSLLGPFGLALLVVLIDLNIAVILTSGARLLERMPVLGRWLVRLRMRANRALEENPGLANLAFFGVVLYVFLPLAATGSVTGTLAARLLGISRLACLAAVGLGSVTISLTFALFAAIGKQQSEALGPEITLLSLVVVGGLGWIVLRRVRRILRHPGDGPKGPDSHVG